MVGNTKLERRLDRLDAMNNKVSELLDLLDSGVEVLSEEQLDRIVGPPPEMDEDGNMILCRRLKDISKQSEESLLRDVVRHQRRNLDSD